MIGELTGEIAERRTDSMVIRVDGTGLGLEVSRQLKNAAYTKPS